MGVWRDSVRSQYDEETGACRAMQRGTIDKIVARTTSDSFAVLTPRRLMGVNPQVPGSSPGRGAKINKLARFDGPFWVIFPVIFFPASVEESSSIKKI